MILRPLSLCTFAAAALAGLHLYQTKHDVALLDRELRGIARQIDEAQDRAQSLQAEWAWLNEPERLRGVAQRHLQLEPMQPTQFLRLNEAERRLPAIAIHDEPAELFAAPVPQAPAGPVRLALLPRVPAPVQLATHAAPLATVLPPRTAAPAALPGPQVETVRQLDLTSRAVEAKPVQSEATRAAPRPAPAEVARPAPPPRPAPPAATAPRPAARATELASLPPVAAPVRAVPAAVRTALAPTVGRSAPLAAPVAPPALRPAVTQVATAAPAMPRPVPAEASAIALGSALGGSRALLAPPVPFGSANASTLAGPGPR